MTRAERRAKLEATVRVWIDEGHLKPEDSDPLVDDLERILDEQREYEVLLEDLFEERQQRMWLSPWVLKVNGNTRA